MSLEIKGKSCPICKAYLFEEDDVAVCPTCGAPHHRECFVSAGRCGMEEFHGTDKQYDKLKNAMDESEEAALKEPTQENEKTDTIVKCRSCNGSYPSTDSFCPHCGAPNMASNGAPNGTQNSVVIRFDYLGGVKPDEDLGEGHKADDVKNFVAVSTNRFIPRFKEFKKGAKVSFSVWHLLFPSASFAMRKMYSFAAIAGAIEIAATLLMIPFNMSIGEIMTNTGITDYYGLAQYLMTDMDKALLGNFLLSAAGLLLQAFVRIMSGLFANKLYYKHVIKNMSDINASASDDEERLILYRKSGGVNLFAFTLVYMAVTWLPSLIYTFI